MGPRTVVPVGPAEHRAAVDVRASPRHHTHSRRPAHPNRGSLKLRSGPLAAARQFYEREHHLRVPRQHIDIVDGIEYKTGAWVANVGSRVAKLAPERVAELSAIGMRWV
ncbi:helicase associated domain-containing protein [Streptomyces flavidovirens]|uniref:Helicase associated domain-containing protein n=1 Tax=Streptomyces flavidovirens TaxID=67298 RepID=A0ABW6RNN1_9ACTN